MAQEIASELLNGRAMLINRHSGLPTRSRIRGVVSVRPGIGAIAYYKAVEVRDQGRLIVMSCNGYSRFYLFNNLYRGSLLAEGVCRNLQEARDVIKAHLDTNPTQANKDFKKRLSKWLGRH